MTTLTNRLLTELPFKGVTTINIFEKENTIQNGNAEIEYTFINKLTNNTYTLQFSLQLWTDTETGEEYIHIESLQHNKYLLNIVFTEDELYSFTTFMTKLQYIHTILQSVYTPKKTPINTIIPEIVELTPKDITAICMNKNRRVYRDESGNSQKLQLDEDETCDIRFKTHSPINITNTTNQNIITVGNALTTIPQSIEFTKWNENVVNRVNDLLVVYNL